jgi:hypothetical protein
MNKPKKETVGTRYFLIAFGNFKNNQELMMNLFKQFTPVLSSNVLKFHFGDDYVLAHFETEETQKDIREFCNIVLSETIENFLLIPNNKNIFVSLPNELQDFLLNLDEDLPINNDNLSQDDDSEDVKDFMEQLLEKVMTKKEDKLTLDELLDKIQSNGIESLTEKEKNQLYDYSKGI